MLDTEENQEAFIEIIKRHIGKTGRVNWNKVTPECNKLFGYDGNNDLYRTRYNRIRWKKDVVKTETPKDYTCIKKILLEELKKEVPISKLERVLKISKYEILGLIKEVNDEGLYQIAEKTNGYQISKCIVQPKLIYQHYFGNVTKESIMVVSDSHMGSIYELVEFLNFLYEYAAKRGITKIYHIGDITDGLYTNRAEQIYALTAIGFDAQAKNIIDKYPRKEGITTYFILGNHDETHIRNGGANIGIAISRARPDMIYLGIGTARVMLAPNCSMDMLHPLDGSSYALSYSGQKYMDALTGGDKPNILLVGHHHKAMYMFYRNIHYYEVPSTCLQSNWEKRNRINNTAGAWILNIEVDSLGTVVSISNELIPHYAKKTTSNT